MDLNFYFSKISDIDKRKFITTIVQSLTNNSSLKASDKNELLIFIYDNREFLYQYSFANINTRLFEPLTIFQKLSLQNNLNESLIEKLILFIIEKENRYSKNDEDKDFPYLDTNQILESLLANKMNLSHKYIDKLSNIILFEQKENIINEYNESIKDKYTNPFLDISISILEQSLINPSYFENFVKFWQKNPKNILISSKYPLTSEDNKIQAQLDNFYSQKDIYKYIHEKQLNYLCDLISNFFSKHPQEYEKGNNIIPPAFVFLRYTKHQLIFNDIHNNFNEIHYNYFQLFKDNTAYPSFVIDYLFNQKWLSSNNRTNIVLGYKHIQNIIQKPFILDLFYNSNFTSNKPNNEENMLYLLNSADRKTNTTLFNELLPFIRKIKIESKLSDFKNKTKNIQKI